MFICNGLDDVELGDGGPCGSVDRRIQQCLSGALLGGWAVGGEVICHKFCHRCI